MRWPPGTPKPPSTPCAIIFEQHSEEATAAVRIAYSQLYVPG